MKKEFNKLPLRKGVGIVLLNNKNKILTDELNDLRNVAIDEGIYETVDEEDY